MKHTCSCCSGEDDDDYDRELGVTIMKPARHVTRNEPDGSDDDRLTFDGLQPLQPRR